jgi:hypothetical protein
MWPFLPKKCNCPETPTNTGTSCDHSGLTTNDLIYHGADGVCSNVTTGMTSSEVFQQLDYFICSIELTQHILNLIQENPSLFPDFITLVNGAINCDTIIACGPPPTTTTTSSSTSTTSTSTSTTSTSTSSTTTTTTTVAQACYVYNLTATIDNASWTATQCYGGITSGILPFVGNIFTTPCIINTSLVLNGITAVETPFNCSTTTTTSSTSSTTTTTSTSTSSTTTTTTTAEPTTTTTTTTIALQEALISSSSDIADACGLPLGPTCWVSGTGDISIGDFVYTDALGTTPFIGDGDYYRIQILIYPNTHSAQITGGGEIVGTPSVCP